MTIDPLEDEAKRFIAEELQVRFERLTLATRLQHDLGVDGDDGWEFMEAFGKKFGIDMSEFQSSFHFGPEAGCNPIAYLVLLVFRPQSLRYVPIAIGDLLEAVRFGRWRTPDRQPV